MADKGSAWLKGCGIGCGVLVLLAIAVVVLGTVWIRGSVKEFDSAIETREALEARFGQVGEYVPWPDGSVPPDRMEAFLAVRDATAPSRARFDEFFSMIPDTEEEQRELDSGSALDKLRFGLKMGRSGAGLAGNISEFFQARNRALAEMEMGLGEYTYIFVTAYYGWLGHDPGHQPGQDPDGSRASRTGRWEHPRVRRDYLEQLRNQLDSVSAETSDRASTLAAEIESMESDPRRLPWAEGLPEPVRTSLEPYRERLEASYSPDTNAFELAISEKRGWGSITAR